MTWTSSRQMVYDRFRPNLEECEEAEPSGPDGESNRGGGGGGLMKNH